MKVGVGLIGLAVVAVVPAVAFAAPSSPMGAAAVRVPDDPHKIRVAWKPVPGVDHYVVGVNDGVTDTVNVVPANVNAFVVDAPDPCARYLIRIGARDAAGAGGTVGPMTVRSLVPGVPGGLAATRTAEDRSVATASWRVPMWTGYAPQFSYRTQLVGAADDVTVLDRTTTDLQAMFTGVDRAEKYTLNLTSVNEYGSCLVAKATIGSDRPGVPRELTAVRDNPADPASVSATWTPPADLSAPPTYYLINYWSPGKLTRTVRVDAPATTGRLSLDPARSWTVRVQSFNDVGGSATLSNTVTLEAIAGAGNPDTIAPTVMPTVTPTPRAGWNSTPVTVIFSCADTLSGVETCTDPVRVAAEGAAQTVPGTAVDHAGNMTTKVASVSLDLTPPTITAAVSPEPTAAGWSNGPVTVTFSCADALSGLAVCPDPVEVPADVATRTVVTGTATDKAGNTSTASVTVNIDRTAPNVTATVIGLTDPTAWSATPLTIHYTCADALSGMDSCPADLTVDTDGADQKITRTATDNAGNTTTAETTANIDTTAPTITAILVGAKNPTGWYTGPVTVHFSCADTLSGIDTCPADVTVDTDGADQTVTGTATDNAGNTATTTVNGIDMDRTAPTVTVTGAHPGATYTLDALPTIGCQTTDATSGVTAQATATVNRGEHGRHTATCAGAVDTAGHTAPPATATYTVTPTIAALTALTDHYIATNDAPARNGLSKHLTNLLAKGKYCNYIATVGNEPTANHPNLTTTQAADLTYWATILTRTDCWHHRLDVAHQRRR